ncbi:F-box/LRR-repeat protein 5 [Protopterus annectens]|uniref:F-box/LRR-repeat protein 5 n=1 Tax=Protopterus annectens TaxID=7888 RepID=UPI001CFB1E19|nr:F-box/LRR-repeat protein 5 [Protopterus annectens]
MAPFPEEVDVFSAPHWRMKQLVGLYSDKLSKTNFSNNNDFRALLQSLSATFREFKMHEQIENEYIIGLLQERSRTMYNVHSDNKLSEMLSLLEKGLRSIKNEYEQLKYAQQLKERLEAFTSDFLPHMKEEEEVFQPMLMEYFSYEELKDIKKIVIAQHSSHKPKDCTELLKDLNLLNQSEEREQTSKYSVEEKSDQDVKPAANLVHISQLPPEVMLKIFSFLNPQELCQCSQVQHGWSELARTGSLWKHLYPVRWARGDWYSGPPREFDEEPDEEWVISRSKESQAFQEWDEDADIDESEEASEESTAVSVARQEKCLLQKLIHSILPWVGPYVKTVVLAYSSAASSKMVRHILDLCPNLEHLDLTQTSVTDSAFDSWSFIGSCQSLRHLDLSGCEKITDITLERISVAVGDVASKNIKADIFERCINKNRNPRFLNDCMDKNKLIDERLLPVTNNLIPLRCVKFASCPNIPTHVWLIHMEDLVDIEDAEKSRLRNIEGLGLVVPSSQLPCGGSGCCSRDNSNMKTRACWQRYRTSTALAQCGHSLCSAETALRTTNALPVSSALVDAKIRAKQTVERKLRRIEGKSISQGAARVLKFLSLSGCYQITDHGLRALVFYGGLPSLEHLNLSGCLLITGAGLQDLVSVCPSLNDEHFYYCDNIVNGPHSETASGCQNLQCGFRVCCRSGE